MKCPKCGFNSFEFLDSCKKCGSALTPFKQDLGIRAVVLPSRRSPAPPPGAGTGFAPATENGADLSSPPQAEPVPAEPPGESLAGAGMDLAETEVGGNAGPFDFTLPFLEGNEVETGGNWSGEAGGTTLEEISLPEFEGFSEAFSLEEGGSAADHAASPLHGEFELDVFPLEEKNVSARKATPSGEGTDGTASDEFDSLFGAPETDKI